MPSLKSRCIYVLAFLLALLSLPSQTLACQYSSNSDELGRALEDRNEMRRLVAELAESANAIFIGDINSLTDKTVTFRDIVVLKGLASETDVFEWERSAETWIGCSGLVDFRNIQLEAPSDQPNDYLVYAKQGKIIRVNNVGSFAESLGGYEEVEWLKE